MRNKALLDRPKPLASGSKDSRKIVAWLKGLSRIESTFDVRSLDLFIQSWIIYVY